jgi:phosphoserine phosphatase
MTHVATLVCDPARPVLTGDMLRHASEVLAHDYGTRESLGRQGPPRWLAQNIAADICFEPRPVVCLTSIAERLRAALDNAAVDVIVQESRGRRKKLLLADMDSTIIGQECLDELADEIGARKRVAAITERAMRGDIAFKPALLKGLGRSAICRVIDGKITLTPGACALVRTMRAKGAHTVLVSGGFSVFTSVIADRIGFHEHRANELLFDQDGRLTGCVAEPVLGKDAKLAALGQLRETLGLSAVETLAVGDGANDLAMLKAAGLGVAYHAKPKVAATAHARIDHGDLTALLYAQGYGQEEFVIEAPEQPRAASFQRSPS